MSELNGHSNGHAKHPGGRPTKYRAEFAQQVFKLTLLGATDKDLAEFFEVEEKTINNWKQEYPKFLQSLKDGKDRADSRVAKRLYRRAMGYSHPEDKIFNNNGEAMIVPTIKHYPPDTTAAIFWLKNRQPGKWRDEQKHDVSGGITIRYADEQSVRMSELHR